VIDKGVHILEIPRTQRHSHSSAFKIRDQFIETRLWFLLDDGGGFDGADGALGFGLGGLGEGVDVVEYVC